MPWTRIQALAVARLPLITSHRDEEHESPPRDIAAQGL